MLSGRVGIYFHGLLHNLLYIRGELQNVNTLPCIAGGKQIAARGVCFHYDYTRHDEGCRNVQNMWLLFPLNSFEQIVINCYTDGCRKYDCDKVSIHVFNDFTDKNAIILKKDFCRFYSNLPALYLLSGIHTFLALRFRLTLYYASEPESQDLVCFVQLRKKLVYI